MNKLKTAMLVTGAVVTVSGAGLGAVNANATNGGDHSRGGGWWSNWNDWRNDDKDMKYDAALAEALTQKFNLNKTEVESVIKQVRTDQTGEVKDQKYDKLSTALSEGKLTQVQYDKINSLYQETDALIASLDATTDEQKDSIKDQIKAKYGELKQYLKDQNLSWKNLGYTKDKDHDHNS